MNLADQLLASPERRGAPLSTTPPAPTAPFTETDPPELEQLKARLLRLALASNQTPGLAAALRRAANEAAALAWLEPHPLLVFPTLFEEYARSARLRVQRESRAPACGWALAAA